MSVSAFRGGYSNKLLKRLNQESKRKSVERQSGQALILKDLKAFETVIETSLGKSVPPQLLHNALEAGRRKALNLHNGFKQRNKRRYNNVVSRLQDIRVLNHYTLGTDIFIVSSFKRSLDLVKKEVLDVLENSGFLTNTERKDVSFKTHKGHGVAGSAVSEVEIASSLRDVSKEDMDVLGKAFSYFAEKAEIPDSRIRRVQNLINSYSQVVTKKGSLNASYISIIEFQEGRENTGIDSAEEREVKSIFRKFLEEIGGADYLLNLEGSSSLLDKIEKVVIDSFDGRKNLKVTKSIKASKASLRSKATTKDTGAKYSSNVKVSKGGPKPKTRKTRAQKGVSSAPLYLIGIMNEQLPRVIQKNMDAPALENRTGRFASSVRVTDIAMTAGGFPSIGYTYMKGPYQTFEPGFRQGSVERDPRRLIDKSMREIAMQYAIGRFYTRRV